MKSNFKEITLDWDNCFRTEEDQKQYFRWLMALVKFRERHVKEIINIYMRLSSSGTGVHIKIVLKKPISFLKLMQYRALLWDDPVRLKMDLIRSLVKGEVNRLWDVKIKDGKTYKVKRWIKI
jgi:hypothetical protein